MKTSREIRADRDRDMIAFLIRTQSVSKTARKFSLSRQMVHNTMKRYGVRYVSYFVPKEGTEVLNSFRREIETQVWMLSDVWSLITGIHVDSRIRELGGYLPQIPKSEHV